MQASHANPRELVTAGLMTIATLITKCGRCAIQPGCAP